MKETAVRNNTKTRETVVIATFDNWIVNDQTKPFPPPDVPPPNAVRLVVK